MTPPTPGQPTLHELTQRIKDQALAVGFDLVGVAPVQESPELAFFERWLDAGYAGEMHYLQRSRERRRHLPVGADARTQCDGQCEQVSVRARDQGSLGRGEAKPKDPLRA